MRKHCLLVLLMPFIISCQHEKFGTADKMNIGETSSIEFVIQTENVPVTKSGQNDILNEQGEFCDSVFRVDHIPFEDISTGNITKVVPVSTLNQFYLNTGKDGQSVGNVNTVLEKNNNVYTAPAGLYWPASNPSYDFFCAASRPMGNSSSDFYHVGCFGDEDVVVACIENPFYKTQNTLTFEHVYSRVGTLSLIPPAGFTATLTSASLLCCQVGTYNIRTHNWIWKESAHTVSLSASNDIYVIPETYSLSVTYNISDGSSTTSVTKTGYITLLQGCQNNITLNLGVPGSDIDLSSVFTIHADGKIKKVTFTRGNLKAYVNNTSSSSISYSDAYVIQWAIHSHQYDYIKTQWILEEPRIEWVDLFSWTAKNKYSDSAKQYGIVDSYDAQDYRISVSDAVCDWGSLIGSKYSILSANEWQYLLDNRLALCSDGTTKEHTINGVKCLIFKPDNYSGTVADSYTADTWIAAENSGLVAIPFAGDRYNFLQNNQGTALYMWTSTPHSSDYGEALSLRHDGTISSQNTIQGSSVRLVRVLSEYVEQIVGYNYQNVSVSISASPTSFSATGGTSTLTYSASYQKQPVYSSGHTGAWETISVTPYISGEADGFTQNGTTVTVANNSGLARSVTYYANYSIGGVSAVQKSVTIKQAGNEIKSAVIYLDGFDVNSIHGLTSRTLSGKLTFSNGSTITSGFTFNKWAETASYAPAAILSGTTLTANSSTFGNYDESHKSDTDGRFVKIDMIYNGTVVATKDVFIMPTYSMTASMNGTLTKGGTQTFNARLAVTNFYAGLILTEGYKPVGNESTCGCTLWRQDLMSFDGKGTATLRGIQAGTGDVSVYWDDKTGERVYAPTMSVTVY